MKPKKSKRLSHTKRQPRTKLTEICSRFNVAGVQYSDYQERKSYKAGTVLTAVWERSNPFDDMAIKLFYHDTHIGYVPKNNEAQDIMHQYRERGIKLRVVLSAYNMRNPSWFAFVVKILAPTTAENTPSPTF